MDLGQLMEEYTKTMNMEIFKRIYTMVEGRSAEELKSEGIKVYGSLNFSMENEIVRDYPGYNLYPSHLIIPGCVDKKVILVDISGVGVTPLLLFLDKPIKHFYIASSLKNENAGKLMSELKLINWIPTYDWIDMECGNETTDELITIMTEEALAIERADVVILCLEGGWGAHVEFGIAIGSSLSGKSKKIYVYSEEANLLSTKACGFYYHPKVIRVSGDIKEIVKIISQN